jgi:NAD(P)H-hydrate repair Nnr-like enzyme with NAD(P)H-hydrate epimerase domain
MIDGLFGTGIKLPLGKEVADVLKNIKQKMLCKEEKCLYLPKNLKLNR